MQAVHHQLRVVVYKGFLGIKHAQWTPQTFAHCFLGELGLEDVLEAKGLFFRSDVEEVGLVIPDGLEGQLLGGNHQGEVTFTLAFVQVRYFLYRDLPSSWFPMRSDYIFHPVGGLPLPSAWRYSLTG